MPMYEFICEKCKTNFDVKLTIANFIAVKIFCPKCGSDKLKRIWSVPFVTYKGKGFYNTDKDNK